MVLLCDFQNLGDRKDIGQRDRGNTAEGVAVAGLEGHVFRFAVYLVHKALNLNGLDLEGLGPARCGVGQAASAERLAKKHGCYHMGSVNVL